MAELSGVSPWAGAWGHTWEGAQREVRLGVVPGAHQHGVEDSHLLLPLALCHHLPLARGGEVRALGHAAHAGLGAGGSGCQTPAPPRPR